MVVTQTCFGFFLLLSWGITVTEAKTQIFMGSNCQNTSQEPLSIAYQANLDKILAWMSSDAATSKGYNHTSIGINTTVYGQYDCRGDVAENFCQFCVSFASREAPKRCPNRVSAIVWYEYCMLRYSNESFFGKILTHPTWHALGTKNVSNMEEVRRGEGFVKSMITKATQESNHLYYLGSFNLSSTQKRFGMVHCGRDLSNAACRQCLEALLEQTHKCCEQNIGWFIWSGTCMIRYDDQMFYRLSNQTSSLPPSNDETDKQRGYRMSKILIISISVMGSIILCLSVYWWCYRKRVRKDWFRPSSFHKIQTEESWTTELPIIPLTTILQSTDNFSEACKLGEGGFGTVYKGILADGTQIAVKRLSKFSGQGSEEFNNEVLFIANLQHRNLVRLLACCLDENENILVYEYLPNKSLDFHLFDDEKRKQFDWKLRLRIINGTAKGILYLHEDSRVTVIHRDLKASNVLLDHDMNPKISDFGLARAFEIGQKQAKTKRVMGTYGYMAPEYVIQGLFSVKSDVFSFGVLVLEIIYGRKNSGLCMSEHGQTLLLYAWRTWGAGKCLETIDPMLEKSFIGSEIERCIQIGLLCVQEDAIDRPTMSQVVLMLANDTMILPKPKHPAFSIGIMASEVVYTSKSSKNVSNNDLTVSVSLPR
ncbi:cysteine-rich receptor-like protein kinase 10 isoform X3 [Vigna radiata var. radiata]|uniref:Cysteine-rich receptor-like protein kinase 10 isoform X3 n=1 Tax=Vigna radiata var. radiata TaxID=3916 RepID=A0A1S3TDG6_VIGRR|nr:cysteine-rich receptor-like protein kinase 10 isoform X3 [Vigna radiata var. radiata]